jgi:serine phosphatase RsbU (regulator of sigma subunit)
LWICNDGQIREIKADKQPIGSFEHRKPFTNHIIQLNGGERIYIFTDGYADQFGGEKGKKFKYTRLKELVISSSEIGMKEQKAVFDSELKAWQGSMEQVDDVLVIGVSV